MGDFFEEVGKTAKDITANWQSHIRDADTHQISPNEIEEIGEQMIKEGKKIPKPPTPSPSSAVKSGRFADDFARYGHQKSLIDMARRGKKSRGLINLGVLIAAGTVSAPAVGAAVLAYVAEEAAIASLGYAWNYADELARGTTPTTKQECHNRYNEHIRKLQGSFTFAKTGYIAVPPEKNWFEITYGVSYGSLK